MAETQREAASARIADALARLLSRLVAGVGVLALAVLGGGAFARYAAVARRSGVFVTLEDAARATHAQICELARCAQQSNPELIARVQGEALRLIGA